MNIWDGTPKEKVRQFLKARPWKDLARENQLPPPGDWRTWLLLAGRGFGKTRTGAEWVHANVERYGRWHLVGPTASAVRDVMVEGESGVLATARDGNRPKYEPSKLRLTWPNGAVASLFSADEPDRLRGPQCFVAGTLVATRHGNVPIEYVHEGDWVWTRAGLRRVVSTLASPQRVGTVTFSNGATLTGTADHPVLSSDQWVHLTSLRSGMPVHVGTWEAVDTSSATPAARCSTSTASSGSERTDPSRMVGTFTTSTMTERTTVSATLRLSRLGGTTTSTLTSGTSERSRAPIAARLSRTASLRRSQSASPASPSEPRPSARPSASATTVGPGSYRVSDCSAVSVASTWRPAGVADVYNLTVEELPEYFANGVLVHNCEAAWSEEVATWRYPEAWDMLQLGLRLGPDPRQIVTTTPRPIRIIKDLIADPNTAVVKGSTYENRANLAPAFFAQIISRYEGTRLGRQELYAELLTDTPGALWKLTDIDHDHIPPRVMDTQSREVKPDLRRVVVAVDPAVTSGEDSDETGIVVSGLGSDGRGYVLADRTLRASPDAWARVAVNAYHEFKADRIVAESNNGGEMVSLTIRTVDPNVPVRLVTASRGKRTRAEPIAALYEQHRITHLGSFPELEDQMCGYTPESSDSPDRMDALVWALTDLMLKSAWGSNLGSGVA